MQDVRQTPALTLYSLNFLELYSLLGKKILYTFQLNMKELNTILITFVLFFKTT